MSPNLMGLVSAAIYGMIVLQVKMVAERFGVVASMVCYLPVAWGVMCLIYAAQRIYGTAAPLPTSVEFVPLFLLGLSFALGQSSNTFAYTIGANPVIISCLFLSMPIFVAIYSVSFFGGTTPSAKDITGYAIIALGTLVLFWDKLFPKAAT